MKKMNERTKRMFVEAILELVTKKDLSKISITELCDYCGTDRQTFYYHFKDKYDLIAWIYECDWKHSFEHHDLQLARPQTLALLKQIEKKQLFYRKAFEDQNQNSLFSYMRNANLHITEEIIYKNFPITKLTDEQHFALSYHSFGWVCSLSEWVINKCEPCAEIYANYLSDNAALLFDALRIS